MLYSRAIFSCCIIICCLRRLLLVKHCCCIVVLGIGTAPRPSSYCTVVILHNMVSSNAKLRRTLNKDETQERAKSRQRLGLTEERQQRRGDSDQPHPSLGVDKIIRLYFLRNITAWVGLIVTATVLALT